MIELNEMFEFNLYGTNIVKPKPYYPNHPLRQNLTEPDEHVTDTYHYAKSEIVGDMIRRGTANINLQPIYGSAAALYQVMVDSVEAAEWEGWIRGTIRLQINGDYFGYRKFMVYAGAPTDINTELLRYNQVWQSDRRGGDLPGPQWMVGIRRSQ